MPLNVNTDLILDEFLLLKSESQLPKYYYHERIDTYWQRIFDIKRESGEYKYVYIPILIKSVLILSHGQADVERGFSKSVRTLTKERANMNEQTLNNILLISSALEIFYDNNIKNIEIDKKMLQLGLSAYKNYEAYLNLKKEKEREKQRQWFEEEEKIRRANELKKYLMKTET